MKTLYCTMDAFGRPIENAPHVDYSVLAQFDMDRSNSEYRLAALTLGIPAAYDFMERFLDTHTIMEAVSYSEMRNDNIPRVLLMHAMIQCFYNRSQTYGELKMKLVEMSKSIHAYRQMFRIRDDAPLLASDIMICNYIRCLVQTLRADQMEKKALETSVITGCTPIVPYAGVLKKPFNGEHPEKPKNSDIKPIDEDEPEDKDLLKWFSTMEQDIEEESSVAETKRFIALNAETAMEEALQHPTSAASVMYFHDMFRTINDFDKQDLLALCHNIRMSRQNPTMRECGLHRALLYYGFAYVATNFFRAPDEDVTKLIHVFQESKRFYLADIEKEEFSKVFQNIYNNLPANESALLSDMDKMDALSRFSKNPNTFTLDDTDRDPLDLFDLVPLMNYIYTNRRFRTNAYARSAFMDLPSIGGYTFYRGFLIIEPQTPEGHELNFLYIPVIDDLNGSQVAIIKYWRNGHIDVLTESEYQKEIMG